MNPVSQMRSWINSMHIAKAVNIGVEVGLFGVIAEIKCPTTVQELARQACCDQGYVESWIHVMQAAGIIDVDQNGHLSFVSDWKEALTDRDSDKYVPPMMECHFAIADTYPRFAKFFRNGNCMHSNEFSEPLLVGIAADAVRFANYFLHVAVDKIPDLKLKLEEGIDVLDVGCGGGQFLSKIATQFPKSRYVGIDPLDKVIDMAREEAKHYKVESRVDFIVGCGSEIKKECADLIILNEVPHEMDAKVRQPVLDACCKALKKDGLLFLVDILAPENAGDYVRPNFLLSSLVQFFEKPWGSKLLTYSELKILIRNAGFSDLTHLVSADDVVVAYTKPI
ncbi:MAG: class I SAM-dependent methyltransferase [Pseudomonadota bacterium]